MPYNKNSDLPEPVKKHLPNHAQDIYREAYNHARAQYADSSKEPQEDELEELSHKVAWAAVKKKYEKREEGQWVKKE